MKPYIDLRSPDNCATLGTHRATIAVSTPLEYCILSVNHATIVTNSQKTSQNRATISRSRATIFENFNI